MEITCSRRIQFCSGHRVMGHENKCRHLHGHNYVVWMEARGRDLALDGLGRVIDFSVLKDRVGGWIEYFWDHGLILFAEDIEIRSFVDCLLDQKTYYMPMNPTAENMAIYLLKEIGPEVLKDTGVELVRVEVLETENCKGVASL